MTCRNRGGFYSEMNAGRLPSKSPAPRQFRPLPKRSVHPSRYCGVVRGWIFHAASQWRRTDTGIQRGDFRIPAAALNGHWRTSADSSGGRNPGGLAEPPIVRVPQSPGRGKSHQPAKPPRFRFFLTQGRNRPPRNLIKTESRRTPRNCPPDCGHSWWRS